MIKVEWCFLVAMLFVFSALMRRRRRFLMVLLALEVLIVFVIVLVYYAMCGVGLRVELFVFMMLAMGACEGSLGLSILVALVRARGNDRLRVVSIYKVY